MESRTENPLTATPETTRVIVSNYMSMGITIIVLIFRLGFANFKWRRSFGLDDLFLFLAICTGITESALTEQTVSKGLGTYIRPGNSSRLKDLSQFVYTTELLFLVTLFFAKMSTVRLVYRMSSNSTIAKGKILILQILIIVWIIFSVPAIAFQCGTELPWLYAPDRCVGAGAFWYPILILSILIDAWLSISPWATLPEMQLSQKQRQTVLGLFGSRILACILGVAHLALLAPALKDINQPRAMPNPTVLKQLSMNMSIITAAVPVLYKALACYTPAAQAVIYNVSEREQATTPLEDMKVPNSTELPNPEKFDAFIKETMALDKPSLGTGKDDFSGRFSVAFNKEIEIATKV